MAALYAAADGTLARALLSAQEEALWPDPPPGAVGSLTFDPDSNPALVADLRRSTDAYRLQNGTLTKNGQPVTINPPGRGQQDRLALSAIIAKLDADQALTAPEQRVVLRFLLTAQVG